MTQRSPEREQFLADVLTTAVEGGIQYWGLVSEYKHEYSGVPVADTYAIVHEVSPEDGDEDEDGFAIRGRRVTIDTIAHGIQVLTTGENAGKSFSLDGHDYWQQFLLANRTNGEDGDYDADIADNVLQAGLFGEVVYG